MRVLVSAIACRPDLGSEARVGWNAVNAIAKQHECHVVTHVEGRAAIEKAQAQGEAAGVNFHYCGNAFRWHPSRFIARLQSWMLYRKWQAAILPDAMQLHRRHRFDLVHHVTYVTWRMAPRLWQMPVPFVWGPIGGASNIDRPFLNTLSPSARAFEIVRCVSGLRESRSSAFRRCARHASFIIAAEEQTASFMARHAPSTKIGTLCPVFFTQEQLNQLNKAGTRRQPQEWPLRIFAGGNLEGRKGIAIALRALSLLKDAGASFTYTIGGAGPELPAMRELALSLGLNDVVTFHNGYAGTEYADRLRASDIYLLPSVRETAGITMMEAVLAGCYPIVMAHTGAGEIIERIGCRPLIAANPAEAVERVAQELEWCHKNRSAMIERATEAGRRLGAHFSEQRYLDTINGIYSEAVSVYPRSE